MRLDLSPQIKMCEYSECTEQAKYRAVEFHENGDTFKINVCEDHRPHGKLDPHGLWSSSCKKAAFLLL